MLYTKYLELKSQNKNGIYLFKVGKFYIFLEDDARKISKITTLKLTNHTKNIVKCGFPKESLNKYLELFNNLNLNIEIVEDKLNEDKLIKYLKNTLTDIDNITPRESINILYKIKEYL